MGGAYNYIALVEANVIDTVGNSFSLGQAQKVVHIDLTSLLPPRLACLLKVADQLTLFGIDTNDRPLAAQVRLSPAGQVAKLLITVGRLLARQPFVIDPQRIILPFQQPTDRRQAEVIIAGQGLLNFAQRLVRPFQA